MAVLLEETYHTRVLVVDGDPVAASLHGAYVDALEGFETCGTATTIDDAALLARTRRPDLALVDLSFEDVRELLRRLDPVPVVGVTSVHLVHEVLAFRPLVAGLLLKPFHAETFRARLEECVATRRRRR